MRVEKLMYFAKSMTSLQQQKREFSLLQYTFDVDVSFY